MPGKCFGHVLVLVVDGRVEAQFFDQIAALVGTASDADDAGAEGGKARSGRKPRSVAANIAVGGSRMVTNHWQAGKSQAEAKKAGLDRALELARKNGLSTVPDEAVKMIEATLKRRYSKAK